MDKSLNRISFIFGLLIGTFCVVYLTVFFLQHKFEKPWDAIWTSSLGFIGTIAGSCIGGLVAYRVALGQIHAQTQNEKTKQEKLQDRLSSRIKDELQNNKKFIEDLKELLREMENDFKELSVEISKENPEVLEGIIVITSQIETDLLLQLRSELFDIRYVNLHKRIEILDKINKNCENLQKQKVPAYIAITLKRLLELSGEYINLSHDE
ncbi:hypothetical protein [Priestia taiwanensis]|uniref:Uncharacterized protein n=1 Tax=Priestia taiwanensis TaxID=1347902 RepID=A0A917AX59_9BACI|nr:hypothetical protein [Priestia taiwanensis]MBM7364448.1 vacuolar-type H+-ATPase subunit I/STV1 [Priestia taiwanensis]GGE81379.1 hypothetical protein GCM10007140_33710 [Priestia taiwanensis]